MKRKNLILSVVLAMSFIAINAQKGFGIKGGLSYNSNGELKDALTNIDNVIENKGESKTGFNIGFYGEMDLGPIYLRPELVFTKTKSEYKKLSSDYSVSKLDMPVLVGMKVIGPLKVFAGPAFQYIFDNKLKGIDIEDVEQNFTVGMNIGAAIELGRIGIDVRYERGFSSNETEFFDDRFTSTNKYTLDSRPEQIIFSLSYRLSEKKE